MSRRQLLIVGLLVLLGTGGSAVLSARPASADSQRYLRLDGRVQWIAGQTMILATNTDLMGSYVPQALWSVRVDLRRVPQAEYDALAQGDFITVTGVLSDDNRLLIGASIEQPGS